MFPGKDLHIAVQYFLNADLEPELIRRQVRELAAGGYKCIFGHARQGLTTPYLSEGWWQAIDVIVEECETLGILFAIWDEDYYPSPSAGNRVMWDHPEFAAQQVKFSIFEAAPGRVQKALEAAPLLGCYAVYEDGTIENISRFCGTICDQWVARYVNMNGYSTVMKVGAPHWRAGLTGRCFALDWEASRPCRIVAAQIIRNFDRGHNVDLLNADAIRYFLEVTHGAYLKRYGQEKFDKVFAGTFMDEPSVSGLFPWTGKLPELYRERFGKDILAELPHLALDVSEESKPVRLRYRTLQRELLCRNYLDEMQKWCAAHNIPSIGHLSRTEFLSLVNFYWPNELRCCKHLDLPCTDPLGANMGWPDTASYHTGLKVASSAAYWFHKEQAGSDALAVCGNETGLRELQYMAEYQLVLGITWFNLHGAAVSWAGPRKDEVPPSLFYQHTQWSLMKHLWTHLDKESQRLAQGREHVTSVVYYPAAQLIAPANAVRDEKLEAGVHRLSEALLSSHKEFAFIDGVTLSEQQPEAFANSYPQLVIPEGVTFFEPEAEEFFAAYRKAGGTILSPDQIDLLPGVALAGKGAENVFIHRRELADGTLDAYLFNRSDEVFTGALEGKPVEVPPRSGCFAAVPRPVARSVVAELRAWQVRFPENMVMLNRFLRNEISVDLRERATLPPEENAVYQCDFLVRGEISALRFVADAEMSSAPWSLRLNGRELRPEKTGRFYDEANVFYDLLPALRTGSVPALNRLEVITSGTLAEPGYLLGFFKAEFRHGVKALPCLKGADPAFDAEALADWSTWGFGTYSGEAQYHTRFTVERQGRFRLVLGRVESAAAIQVDGRECGVRFSPPYELDLELTQGEHELLLKISNAPGNRDRLSDSPAGLLGPVRLLRLD